MKFSFSIYILILGQKYNQQNNILFKNHHFGKSFLSKNILIRGSFGNNSLLLHKTSQDTPLSLFPWSRFPTNKLTVGKSQPTREEQANSINQLFIIRSRQSGWLAPLACHPAITRLCQPLNQSTFCPVYLPSNRSNSD